MLPEASTPHIRPKARARWIQAATRALQGFFESQAWRTFSQHQTMRTASAMAFDFFLALVPLLAMGGFTVVHILRADPSALLASSALFDLTPWQMHLLVEKHFETLSDTDLAPFAFLGAWWIASDAFHTLIRLCEEIFGSTPRSFVKSRLWALGLALLFVAALALVAFLGFLLGQTGTHAIQSIAGKYLGNGLVRLGIALTFVGLSSAFLMVVYYVALGGRKRTHRTIVPGALVASGLGLVASVLLGYYVTHATRLAVFYGSLLTVVVVMLWLLLWSHALIIGAIVNVTIEDRRQAGPAPTDPAQGAPSQGQTAL